MDWAQVLTVLVVIATNLGTVISLYLHLDNKTNKAIEEGRKETNEILNAIREDMNQFHLAMRDFHGRLCAIEERNKRS